MANLARLTAVWVPVSPTSAAVEFPVPAILLGRSDLWFQFNNPNPFDVAFEGTLKDAPFNMARYPGTSWLIKARERTPTFVSKQPVKFSAVAVGTPGCPLPDENFDYAGCVIGLVYFTGGAR